MRKYPKNKKQKEQTKIAHFLGAFLGTHSTSTRTPSPKFPPPFLSKTLGYCRLKSSTSWLWWFSYSSLLPNNITPLTLHSSLHITKEKEKKRFVRILFKLCNITRWYCIAQKRFVIFLSNNQRDHVLGFQLIAIPNLSLRFFPNSLIGHLPWVLHVLQIC